ncbi:hypothetical protein Hanom_Chr15g01394591 [Helianthus anomalus]
MYAPLVWFGLACNRCWYTLCGRDSIRFDSVRFVSSPMSRHSSVVRPRVRHAKHEEP